MNENPGETPNPLNPTPEMEQGGELMSEPDTQPASVPEPQSTPNQISTTELTQPIMDEVTEANTTVAEEPAVDNLADSISAVTDPTARPMQQAPVATEVPKKKKKNGLFIGAIIFLFLAIACGVAAALIFLNMDKGDAVSAAIEKIMDGKTPANLAIKGEVNFDITYNESPFSKINVDINSEAATTSRVNRVEADITANFRNGDELVKLNLAETYGANGDLFVKIDGITEAINAFTTRQQILNGGNVITSSCVDEITGEDVPCDNEVLETETTEILPEPESDPNEQLVQTIALFGGIAEAVDGEWVKLPLDDVSGLISSDETDSDMKCLADLISDADQNSNTLNGLYKENPFIMSSKEKVSVASRQNPIYKIAIDEEKFANFVNESQKTEAISKFYSCVGYEKSKASAENIAEEFSKWPAIYVEIDGDSNFTRLYFEMPLKDDCEDRDGCVETDYGTVTVDLDFSYPENINVPEPVEYKDFNQLLQGLMSQIIVTDATEE